jgi:hypothetical protein
MTTRKSSGEFEAFRDALRQAYEPTANDRERLRAATLRRLAQPTLAPEIERIAQAAHATLLARILRTVCKPAVLKQVAALLAAAAIGGVIGVTQAPRLLHAPPAPPQPAAADNPAAERKPSVEPLAVPLPAPAPTAAERVQPPDPDTRATKPQRIRSARRAATPHSGTQAHDEDDPLADLADGEVTAASVPAPTPVDAGAQPSSHLHEELELIRAASQALDRSAPATALGKLAEHSRRFSRGVLQQERTGLELIARCMLDTRAAVGRERDAFLVQAPSSPVARRVRNTCKDAR